jgi:hypothetical protein
LDLNVVLGPPVLDEYPLLGRKCALAAAFNCLRNCAGWQPAVLADVKNPAEQFIIGKFDFVWPI